MHTIRKFIIFFSLVVFFGVGAFISVFKSKNIVNYVDASYYSRITKSRDPAAIQRNYDFSGLEGSALTVASKKRLLSGINIINNDAEVGVELGHFVIKGEDGSKVFACQKFDKVLLNFDGEGMASNGELPNMQVESNCEISTDINKISALWIPVNKILGEPVADGEFNYNEGKPIFIQFMNVTEAWPRLWRLKSIKLFDSKNQNQVLEVSADELKQQQQKPIVLHWE